MNAVTPYRLKVCVVVGSTGLVVVVLDAEDADFADGPGSGEIDLQPIRERTGGGIAPATTRTPVGALAVAIDGAGGTEPAAVGR